MRGHEDGNRVPLTKPVEAVPIRPSAKPWQPNKPSPKTNSHSQLRNDITTKPNVKTNWSFAISNKSSINPKTLPQSLLFAKDNVTNVLFLIDSGCEVSILPKNLTNGINHYFKPFSRTIKGIGDNEIHPIGSACVDLKLGNLKTIKHNFWVTQEYRSYGILGMDILMSNKLIICPFTLEMTHQLSNQTTKLFRAADLPTSVVVSINTGEVRDSNNITTLETKCETLLRNYPELTKTPDYTAPRKHNHFLEIIVDNYKPRMIKARRCNLTCQQKVDKNYSDLIARGAVVKGDANMCASPITVVPKKDGDLRICVDYTVLNAHTRPFSYPLPRIDTLSEKIPGGTRFFSTLDLKEAYYSLPLHPNSRKYAAIITNSGVFVPKVTSFGLRNAPTRFQQFMDSILSSCRAFTFVYLDDILVFSDSADSHLSHLKQVLETLSTNGLFLNKSKCSFAKTRVGFLGHTVGVDGVDVMESKVEAVKKLPLPNTRKELKRVIGMINYYHRFLPNLAEVMAPLNEISGGSKASNRAIIKLTDSQIKAYHDTIALLVEAATISYEDHSKPLILFTDASDSHVGAVLEQEGKNGGMRPLAFFSKKLPPFKQVRSTFYKELRGVYLSLKHFQSRILGRSLIIRTDSKSVERAITNEMGNHSPAEQRWICAIKEFNPIVRHIDGHDNVVADSLSRPPQSALHVRAYNQDSDFVYTSESEAEDSESDHGDLGGEEEIIGSSPLNEVNGENATSFNMINREVIAVLQCKEPGLVDTARNMKKTVEYLQPENLAVVIDENNKRVILPESLRLTAFNVAHDRLHLGIDKTIESIAKDYYWPTLIKDVTHWVKSCVVCQATKVTRYNRPKIGFFPDNTERFQFVHIDLVGPLNESSCNNKYILTAKDRATGFLVTMPITDKKAVTVRNAFFQCWVGPFGVPQVVVSDNGREFVNTALTEAFEQLGIDHRFVSPYSPQTNGFIERQHKTINVALRALTDKTNWALHLPLITATLNNTFIEGSPYTPAQYALGTAQNLSGRVMFDKIESTEVVTTPNTLETKIFLNMMAKIGRQFKRHDSKSYYEPGIFECEWVWLKRQNRRKLSTLYHGPYKVLSCSEQSMIIQKNSGLVKVSIRNVKAYVQRVTTGVETDTYNLRERKVPISYAEASSSDEF